MARILTPLLAGLLLALPGLAPAAESDLTGNWKLTILDQGEQPTLWLLRLEANAGKWSGKILSSGEKLPEATLSDLVVGEDRLRFTIDLKGYALGFDGKLPRDKEGNIRGSMFLGPLGKNQVFPVMLEPTQLKSLDDTYEANKETVVKGGSDLRFFNAAFELLSEAGAKKAKPEEVRGWADKAYRAADAYGPRWQRHIATQIAGVLLGSDSFTDVALNYARRAERLLDAKAPTAEQLRVLGTLTAALKKTKQTDEAREVEARLEKVDVTLKPAKYAGRKAKSDRAVLVELFTGAQCPPCVAADVAFDTLGKTYQPGEVILLQYHEHIPGPDALTNRDTESRLEYYQRDVEGTPTVLFNGRGLAEASGGPLEAAADLYSQYRQAAEQLLEKPAGAKVTAVAVRKGDKIDVSAEVSDVDRPDDALRLRLVLVEDEVRYAGGNLLRVHHHVVRGFPGGTEGTAVKGKSAKQAVTVDLEEVRKGLTRYLDEHAKKSELPLPNAGRPMDLKNLKVVAFVQNDRTHEVLQAVQVDVRAAE
jgi:hypothetical protein